MANAKRIGFSQVELNQNTGIVEGRILAQLPAAAALGDVIENGRFAKYDYKTGEVNLTGNGEWMMIYNEEKLYDERKQNHKDFAMVKTNFTEGVMVPRLIAVEVGDIHTTNAFVKASKHDMEEVDLGATEAVLKAATFYVGENGYLTSTKPGTYNGPEFEVAKNQSFTMPDGQFGLKLIRVK